MVCYLITFTVSVVPSSYVLTTIYTALTPGQEQAVRHLLGDDAVGLRLGAVTSNGDSAIVFLESGVVESTEESILVGTRHHEHTPPGVDLEIS